MQGRRAACNCIEGDPESEVVIMLKLMNDETGSSIIRKGPNAQHARRHTTPASHHSSVQFPGSDEDVFLYVTLALTKALGQELVLWRALQDKSTTALRCAVSSKCTAAKVMYRCESHQ
jgi:hypothetical protein